MKTTALCAFFMFMTFFLYSLPCRMFTKHFNDANLPRPMIKFLLALLANIVAIFIVGIDAAMNQEPPAILVTYLALICTPIAVGLLFWLVDWFSMTRSLRKSTRGVIFTIAALLPAAGLLIANALDAFSMAQ